MEKIPKLIQLLIIQIMKFKKPILLYLIPTILQNNNNKKMRNLSLIF